MRMTEKPDPLTTDLWIMWLHTVAYHYYPAGSPRALCGRSWDGQVWDMKDARRSWDGQVGDMKDVRPAINCCAECLAKMQT